jgi:hypothetical protein
LERAYHALQRKHELLLIDYWHAKASETIAEIEPMVLDYANAEAAIASLEQRAES